MRPADEHPMPSSRPNLMTTARHAHGAAGTNILARLDRDSEGAAARRTRWPRRLTLAAGGAALSVALVWTLLGVGRDNPHDAPAFVASPSASEAVEPAEIAASLPPAAVALPDPASLEPIPVLPMLADVVEKAPTAPAVRAPSRPQRSVARAPRAAMQRPRAAVSADDTDVESDVALLSAVLIQAPRHSAERARAESRCKRDKKCSFSDPVPALLQAVE